MPQDALPLLVEELRLLPLLFGLTDRVENSVAYLTLDADAGKMSLQTVDRRLPRFFAHLAFVSGWQSLAHLPRTGIKVSDEIALRFTLLSVLAEHVEGQMAHESSIS